MDLLDFDYLPVALLALIPGLISASILIYIRWKFPKSYTTTLFLWFIGFSAAWQLFEGAVRLTDDATLAARMYDWIWTFSIGTVATGLHFTLSFIGCKSWSRSKLFLAINYMPGTYFTAGILLGINPRTIDYSVTWHWLSTHADAIGEQLMLYWLAVQGIATFSALGWFAWNSRRSTTAIRRRSATIFAGYLIPAIVGITAQIALPMIFGMQELPITTTFIIIFTVASFIALRKFAMFKYIPVDMRHQILNSMSEGITVIDNDGIVQFVNDRFAQLTGYKKSEMQGLSAHALVSGDQRNMSLNKIMEQRRQGKSNQYEIQLQRKDGQIIEVSVSGAPYRDRTGKIIGCLGIHTDVTKQRRAERLLKSALKITRCAGRGIRDTQTLGELICRELNNYVDCHQFFLALHNEAKDELSFPFMNFRDQEKVKGRKLSRILTDMVIHGSNSIHVQDINDLAPTKNPNREFIGAPMKHLGNTIGVLGIIGAQDTRFTENDLEVVEFIAQQIASTIDRQQVLEQLIKSQEQLQLADTIIKNIGNYVLAADENGDIFFASKSVESGLGHSIGDIQGDGWYALNDGTDMRQRKEYVSQAARGLVPVHGSYESWTKDRYGRERCILWQDQRAPGNILVGIGVDITDQKMAHMKVEEEKRHAIQYQSMLLSSQINPHFIFNSLNSVQYYILDKNVEPALNFISEFSRLMRSVLQNSLHKVITLADEIDFLEMYLELEMKRYHDKFTYSIEIDENIEPQEITIPPMLLQPYLENTVVHGIGNKEGKGHVCIRFKSYGDLITCSIEDDGVGRQRAKELKALRVGKAHKSLGMGITQTRLSLLNDLEDDSYSVKVHDLKDRSGTPAGTRIDIQFPSCVA